MFFVNIKSMENKHQNLCTIYDYIINNQPKWLKIGGTLRCVDESSVFQHIFVNLCFKIRYLTTVSKEISTVSLKQTGRYYKKQGKTLCRLDEGSMFILLMQNNTSKMDKNKINIYFSKTTLYTNSCYRTGRAYGQINIPMKYCIKLQNIFSNGKFTK